MFGLFFVPYAAPAVLCYVCSEGKKNVHNNHIACLYTPARLTTHSRDAGLHAAVHGPAELHCSQRNLSTQGMKATGKVHTVLAWW